MPTIEFEKSGENTQFNDLRGGIDDIISGEQETLFYSYSVDTNFEDPRGALKSYILDYYNTTTYYDGMQRRKSEASSSDNPLVAIISDEKLILVYAGVEYDKLRVFAGGSLILTPSLRNTIGPIIKARKACC